jgi:hypothetical protein
MDRGVDVHLIIDMKMTTRRHLHSPRIEKCCTARTFCPQTGPQRLAAVTSPHKFMVRIRDATPTSPMVRFVEQSRPRPNAASLVGCSVQ